MARGEGEGRLKLIRLKYSEHSGNGEEWQVEELTFEAFNLVVGRNATGKSRLLRGIARMAVELSGEPPPRTSKKIEFEVALDKTAPAANAEWGVATQYFPFSGRMNFRRPGTKRLGVDEAYRLGIETFGGTFGERVIGAMEQVGYSISSITEIESKAGAPGLALKEPKHKKETAFRNLSQAQQRTLTLLIFLTFLELEKKPATVLVDDFAEGLDFERAKRLAKMVFEEHPKSLLQFILATNDRYVMNAVPIEHWTVLVEDGTTTRVFNYRNSKQKFDDFKFTGLNNFDFFSMDFARDPA